MKNSMPPTAAMSSLSSSSLENMHYKGVKHMFENGIKRVPQNYVCPLPDRPNVNITEKSDGPDELNLPIIDFAELQGPRRSKVLQSLAQACQTYGFFQLVNHNIDTAITSNMVDASKRFFEMPLSEREKYMSSDMTSPVRYGTSFNQTNDGILSWRDFLKLVCHPLPDVLPHWPSSPPDFSETAVTYATKTRMLFLMIAEAIMESLGLNNDGQSLLQELIENGSQIMVANCYPPCPQPDLTLGMPPHSDYGFLTLLLQDEVRGLQIQHHNKWVTVRPIPGSFVVNVGDHLEIFSNGRYKSVLHRVIVNATACRISVASLHSVGFTSTVAPAAELVNETNPKQYKDTDFASFLEYISSCDSKEKNFLESRKMY